MTRELRRTLITGVSGQDGALLAAQLLSSGVEVIGTHRTDALANPWRLRGLGIADAPGLSLRALDPTDAQACAALLADVMPDAIFHFAGQSRVAESFRAPRASIDANGISTINLLEATRTHAPDAHFVLASSAEIFGVPRIAPQDESTPFAAVSPYGLSKLLAHAAVGTWRVSFGLRCSSAILFNHESEWRDEAFVTRKISRGVVRIALGRQEVITLGNLDARRDFGYAPEHVAAMAAMAARDAGDDFVLATGVASSIREFADAAFAAVDIVLEWRGEGVDEVGVERGTGHLRARVDALLFRPVDAAVMVGNAGKARRVLGFETRLDLAALAGRMVLTDLARERDGA